MQAIKLVKTYDDNGDFAGIKIRDPSDGIGVQSGIIYPEFPHHACYEWRADMIAASHAPTERARAAIQRRVTMMLDYEIGIKWDD